MINIFDFVAVIYFVKMAPAFVNILCCEFALIVVDGAFSDHGADCSFHVIPPFSIAAYAAAFVTFCESNAKALLTASYQKCNLQAGFALSEGLRMQPFYCSDLVHLLSFSFRWSSFYSPKDICYG